MNFLTTRILRISFITILIAAIALGLTYSLITNLKPASNQSSIRQLLPGFLKSSPRAKEKEAPSAQIQIPPLFGASPQSEEERVIALVEKSTPSVVSIVLTKELPVYEQYRKNPFQDPFICQFFGPEFCGGDNFSIPQLRQKGTQEQQVGAGSGFFVSAGGLIVTNKHVVERDDVSYTVVTNDGKKYSAKVVARDPVNDLALVNIEGKGFPVLPLGNSSEVKLGQSVVAIGNALGEFRNTVSKGIISGLSRSITAQGAFSGPEQLSGLIQTDAAINPGNSGGPLLNLKGEVIGIDTAIAGGAQNIGFALPINLGKRVLDQYQTKGKISYPFLGVRYMIITEEFAKQSNLPVSYGALVIRGDTAQDLAVVPGSPADKAGLLENDIILEMNGEKITIDNPLDRLITTLKVGDEITLKVYSKGKERMVKVELGERS
ncbi:MAG: trypsin-like peptidase domain-containing protein [Candidatus Portnoybacteria bacterium]|nr:trypsin-like peptidase domain-containing protein [Candidatus Portnoybacteria bacterium]